MDDHPSEALIEELAILVYEIKEEQDPQKKAAKLDRLLERLEDPVTRGLTIGFNGVGVDLRKAIQAYREGNRHLSVGMGLEGLPDPTLPEKLDQLVKQLCCSAPLWPTDSTHDYGARFSSDDARVFASVAFSAANKSVRIFTRARGGCGRPACRATLPTGRAHLVGDRAARTMLPGSRAIASTRRTSRRHSARVTRQPHAREARADDRRPSGSER